MGGFYGADVVALRDLARQFDLAANKLDATRASIGGRTQLRAWTGPVAARFRSQWGGEYAPRVRQAAESLRQASAELRRNADEQARASSADSGGSSSVRACMVAAQREPEATVEEGRYGSEYTIRSRWGDSYGGTWTVEETGKSGLHGTASANAGYDDASHLLRARGSVEGQVGWSYDDSAEYQNGLLSGGYGTSGFTGARAGADAGASLGLDGAEAKVGADVFLGSEASVNANVDLGGVGAGAEASVMAGVGAKANAEAHVSMDEISLEIELGISLGVGASFKPSISIKPKEIMNSILGFFGQ